MMVLSQMIVILSYNLDYVLDLDNFSGGFLNQFLR